jgi:hypothetical protein
MEMRIARRPLIAGMALGMAFPGAARARSGLDEPVLVLRTANPWALVVGAESARLALYGDGTVVYAARDGRLKSVTLDPSERATLVRDLGFAVLPRFAGEYETTGATDQAQQWFFLFGEGQAKPRIIYVYGNLDGAARAHLSPAIVGAYDLITHFDHPRARAWLPEQIEVMIWPFDHAKAAPLAWPRGWPDLDDRLTRKREEGYSLFLPAACFAELEALLQRLDGNRPVALAGRKWSISARLALPHEERWMDALGG